MSLNRGGVCWHVTEFEEGGVVRHVHDLLFCPGHCHWRLKQVLRVFEGPVRDEPVVQGGGLPVDFGGHKGPETLFIGLELADLQDCLGSPHAEVRPFQVAQHAKEYVLLWAK